jgi:hypothetical protein
MVENQEQHQLLVEQILAVAVVVHIKQQALLVAQAL